MNDENMNNIPDDNEQSDSDPANQNLIQSIEGTETTTSMPAPFVQATTQPAPTASEPLVAVNYSVKKPRHNGFKIALIVAASLVLLAVISVGIFYAFIRTPNSKYDSAIQDMQIMKTTAESIRDRKQTNGLVDFEASQYDASKISATTYVDALKRVKSNPVFDKDMAVELSYVEHKSLIEPYGQSTLDMISTLAVYDEVTTTCDDAMNTRLSLSDGRSAWDDNFAACKKLTKEHPTVASKLFNDKTYTKYVAAVQRLINAAYGYIDAEKTGKSSDTVEAYAEVRDAASEYNDILESSKELSNTAQPSEKIGDVIKVLKERKDVFFRR